MLRRLIVVLAIVSAVALGYAQAPANPNEKLDSSKKPSGNCSVSGRVVTAAEGEPLRSARVGLVQANERKHPLVYATTTDNEGHFEIKQIEAGRYEFFASHTGYLEQQYRSKGTDEGQGAILSLTSGQTVDNVMFRLVRAGVITGKVVDDTGEPLMGVNVSVLHKPSDEELEEAGPRRRKIELMMVSGGSTDDRGEYRVFNLKPGEYYVKATETGERLAGMTIMSDSDWQLIHELGSSFAPIYYPGVLRMEQAQTITISAGEEAQADFAMRKLKMVEVSGRVIGPDGGPATRVYVQLSQTGVEDWGGELGASVDSSGEFSIKSVPPGSYFISAQMQERDKHYSTRQRIEVGEAKVDGLVLSLGEGATIHGRVRTATGAPLPSGRGNAVLQPVNEDENAGFAWTEINKDGTFEFNGVADGSYTFRTYIEQDWFVTSAHLGNEDVIQNGVQVEGGAVKGNLDIVVSNEGAQIEGTVTDSEKNQPLAGVQVKVRSVPETDYNREHFRQAATDQNGHFVAKDIPPGKYKVSARMPKSSSEGPAIKSDAVAVTLGEHEHRVMDFKLAMPKSD